MRRVRRGVARVAALAFTLALCTVSSVRAQRSSARLAIELPDHLILGHDTRAIVRYRAPDPAHTRLFVNAGSLSRAEPSGGQFRVVYTPPPDKYPQVAIFALVTDDGSAFAWKTLPLYGVARVEVSSDPHVQVSVRVGDASFGPAKTNRLGRATIPVVVAPGTRQVMSVASDALGNERRKAIPIRVPPFQRLLSVCPRDDGWGAWIFAVDAQGEAFSGEQLDARAPPLIISDIQRRAAGVYRLEYEVPRQARAGDLVHVSVALANAPQISHSCELNVPLERPHRLELELSRDTHAAPDPRPISVLITPKYHGDRAAEAADLHFEATFGRVRPSHVRSASPVRATWYLPSGFGGKAQAALIVRSGKLRAVRSIALQPGPTRQLVVGTDPQDLQAGSHVAARIRVQARDAFGNRVRTARLRASAEGDVGSFEREASGDYSASYTPPGGAVAQDRVLVRDLDTGAHAAHWVRVRGLRRRLSLAAGLGYVTSFTKVAGPLLLVQVGYRLPLGAEHVHLDLAVGCYQSQTSQPSADAHDRLETTLRAIPLALRAGYRLRTETLDVGPFVGAGAMLVQARLRSGTTGDQLAVPVAPLLWFGADASVALGPGRTALQLGYLRARIDTGAVRGNAGGFAAALGYLLEL